MTPKNTILKKAVYGVFFVLLILLVGSGATAYYFYSQLTELKENPQKVAQDELQKIITQVSKLIVLPDGEQPTLATITDPAPLKEQAFFARAKKGDRVLIYTQARKAILYDSENNKIVEVAPVNIGNQTTQTGGSGGTSGGALTGTTEEQNESPQVQTTPPQVAGEQEEIDTGETVESP